MYRRITELQLAEFCVLQALLPGSIYCPQVSFAGFSPHNLLSHRFWGPCKKPSAHVQEVRLVAAAAEEAKLPPRRVRGLAAAVGAAPGQAGDHATAAGSSDGSARSRCDS